MRLSMEWLQEYIRFSWTPMQLADRLTAVGLEVESMNPVSLGLEKVLVGEVTALEPHPEVSQWKVCRVSLGDGSASLVCGAPNVKVGMKVAIALPETKLPSGLEVEEKVMRGIVSKGMLCSEAELGLGPDGSGLMSLPSRIPPGTSVEEVLGGSDMALEVKVTPNRPDCLSVIGIAREVAAILGKKVQIPKVRLVEKGDRIENIVGLVVKSAKDCPRYVGRVINDLQIGSSPLWMVRRLRAVGLRSINNVVDITNYVLWETGHPLHAFDLDRLERRRIMVRRAQAGEMMFTLDEVRRPLDPEILVIADGKEPVALAGIMGGLSSEVTNKTKHIFLESAWFNPGLVRRGAKRLGLRTEASYRFERGVDPEAVSYASQRASQLLVKLTGGTLAKGALDKYPKPHKTWELTLRHSRIESILGETFKAAPVKQTLERMGLAVKKRDGLYKVGIPSFRPDLVREIDLIEEIARGYGYHRFKGKFTTRGGYSGIILPEEQVEKELRTLLKGFGFVEIFVSSLARKAALEGALVSEGAVPLRNPLSEDMAVLRSSLLPGMLEVVARNFSFGVRDLRLLEIGKTFHLRDKSSAAERSVLGLVITGQIRPSRFNDPGRAADLFDIKGMLDAVLMRSGLNRAEISPSGTWPFLDQGGSLLSGGLALGCLGRIKRSVVEHFDIRSEVFFAELEIKSLSRMGLRAITVVPISRFPAIDRDLSIVVPEDVPWVAIEKAVREVGGEFLEDIDLFDVFRHDRLGPNRKALGISLRFRAPDRTLSAEEVESKKAACLAKLSKAFGATLRM